MSVTRCFSARCSCPELRAVRTAWGDAAIRPLQAGQSGGPGAAGGLRVRARGAGALAAAAGGAGPSGAGPPGAAGGGGGAAEGGSAELGGEAARGEHSAAQETAGRSSPVCPSVTSDLCDPGLRRAERLSLNEVNLYLDGSRSAATRSQRV